MGASLLKYYEWIKQFGGMTAQMRTCHEIGYSLRKSRHSA